VTELCQRIEAALRVRRIRCHLRVPYDHLGVLGPIYARGRVVRREDGPDAIRVEVELPPALQGLVAPFRTAPDRRGDREVYRDSVEAGHHAVALTATARG
jgi:hypothetical protein